MNLKIDQISDAIDTLVFRTNAETAGNLAQTKEVPMLILLGAPDSRYLRNVEREARRFSVITVRIERGPEQDQDMANVVANLEDAGCKYDVVWDDEDQSTKSLFIQHHQADLDNIIEDGSSCTAAAAAAILYMLGVEKKHVAVVGRGHAAKGLWKLLHDHGATQTECHSETENIGAATYPADVIVNTAYPDAPDVSLRGKLVLDVSGTLSDAVAKSKIDCEACREAGPVYVNRHQIGRLNVAVLLYRFSCGLGD